MPTDRPNLLWIMCDQLRAQALGCHGDANLAGHTPHLDRLAAEGADFTLACSQYPVCMPFRGGLVTGQHAHVHGLRVHGDMLPPPERPIARAFNEAGYRTSWFGKWHLASVQSPAGWKEHDAGTDYWVHPDLRAGFTDWCGFDFSNHAWKSYVGEGDRIFPPRLIEGFQTDRLTDLSLEYLGADAAELHAAGTPWFHCISLEAPHPMTGEDGTYGFHAPREYLDRFPPESIVLRENVPESERDATRRRLAGYYAMIANLDDNVGRLLGWLDESGMSDSTVVMFFADHGEMGGSHGCWEKRRVYDESIRLPWIVRAPGVVEPGTRIDTPASGIDIYPTSASLCGVPTPAAVQGVSHAAALRGEAAVARREALVQWLGANRYLPEDPEHQYRAIRTERYTMCVDNLGEALLFDNADDPYQLRNLAGDAAHAALERELRGRLCRAVLDSGEAPPAWLTR